MSGEHHLTAENIAATIDDLYHVEAGCEAIRWADRDYRTQAGVLARQLEHLQANAAPAGLVYAVAVKDKRKVSMLFDTNEQANAFVAALAKLPGYSPKINLGGYTDAALHAKPEAQPVRDGAGAKRKGSTESSGPDASLISLSLDSPDASVHSVGRASEPSNGGTSSGGA